MKDDTFCVMVSIMVGVVGIFSYFGFDIMVFLAETIMHSVKDRCPDCIIDFAGYYAQCLLYACFTVANLIAPVFLARFGSKKTILAAICCFTIYSSNFLLIRNYIFFPCSAIAGIGAALFYCGTGAYAAKHSTEATLARTQALSFMLMMSSMLVSGNYMIVSSALTKDSEKGNSSHNENDASYREFSDAEINTLKIGMMASSVLAIILCLLLPSRRIKGSLYVKATNITIRAQLGLIYKALKNPGLTKLIPHYIFCGAFTCFMNSIYTTSVSFTHIFAHEDNLVAFVCMSMSVGELIIGVAMGLISRRIKSFGLMPAMIMTLVWFTMWATLVMLFTPPEASMRPTKEVSILAPRLYMCTIIGVLCGFVDGSMNNVRIIASATAYPEEPAIAFCVSKFYQAAATGVFYYVSPSSSGSSESSEERKPPELYQFN
ncbi:unnamed protein product, partial [Mesorhabditis spiculigera]